MEQNETISGENASADKVVHFGDLVKENSSISLMQHWSEAKW